MSRGGIHKRINPPIEGPPAGPDAYARERPMRSDESHLCAAGCHRRRMEPSRYCGKCFIDLHADGHGEGTDEQ